MDEEIAEYVVNCIDIDVTFDVTFDVTSQKIG